MLDIASRGGRSLLQVKLFNIMHAGESSTLCVVKPARTTELQQKTMVSGFLLPSTKRNFMFYCDFCLTKSEISRADDDIKCVDILEGKIEGIDH